MQKILTFAALLFTLSAAIGQNTEAVKAYLGPYRYDNVAPPAGPVEFVFSRTTLNRNADGKATYKSLLKTGYFQDGGNYGSLSGVRITEGGKLVPVERYTPAVDQSGTLTRADVGASIGAKAWALPDSTQMNEMADRAIEKSDAWKAQAWAAVRPLWRVVMHIFQSILFLLFLIGAFLRYVSKTAAGESAYNWYGIPVFGRWIARAHQTSAGGLILICWIVTAVTMINIAMWLVWVNWPIWLAIATWFPVQWLAEVLTNHIVPDVNVISAYQAPAGKPLPRG